MRTSEDIKVVQVIAPAASTSSSVTYNGEAIASADGILVAGKGVVLAELSLGAISLSHTAGTAFTLCASALATNPAADIEVIAGATVTVLPADANSVVMGSVNVDALPADKPYVYLKREPSDTDSIVAGANLILTDGKVQGADQDLEFDMK